MRGIACATISRASSSRCRSGRRRSWSSPPIGRPTSRRSASIRKPGMLYDYYGFPEHTYKLSYPAPGAPEVAAEVKRLIEKAGLPVATDARARLRSRRVRAVPDRRSEGRDPGRHAVAAQGSRSGLPYQTRQGARAVARSGRRDRRQRHELPRPQAFPRRRHHAPRPPSTPGSTRRRRRQRRARGPASAMGQGAVGARMPSARGTPACR